MLLLVALLIDRLLGEPRRFHPLVLWGRYVYALEARFNKRSRGWGLLAWLLAILPVLLLALVLIKALGSLQQPGLIEGFAVLVLYLSVGWQSLREHGLAVAEGLQHSLAAGRSAIARIVSRDTAAMTETDVAKAAVESVLENGADAIFAPLSWFVLGLLLSGAELALLFALSYRMINTLDAMWGYTTPRFLQFGFVSAKADDVANYLPARLTALTYSLLGNPRQALRCWREQASLCASPNGGPVMCAGAGSLSLRLGGPCYYHGQRLEKPVMGCGLAADEQAIRRAVALVDRSVYAWLLLSIGVSLFA